MSACEKTGKRSEIVLPELLGKISARARGVPVFPAGGIFHELGTTVSEAFAPLISGTWPQIVCVFRLGDDIVDIRLVVHFGDPQIGWDPSRLMTLDVRDVVRVWGQKDIRQTEAEGGGW